METDYNVDRVVKGFPNFVKVSIVSISFFPKFSDPFKSDSHSEMDYVCDV